MLVVAQGRTDIKLIMRGYCRCFLEIGNKVGCWFCYWFTGDCEKMKDCMVSLDVSYTGARSYLKGALDCGFERH